MNSSFNLDDAVVNGCVPEKFIACIVTMAIRDGADHLFLEPDHRPDVIGAIVQYRVDGQQYDLVPPPFSRIKSVIMFAKDRANKVISAGGILCGSIEMKLGQEDFTLWGLFQDDCLHMTLRFPRLPLLQEPAARLLVAATGENGLIEFEDADFESY